MNTDGHRRATLAASATCDSPFFWGTAQKRNTRAQFVRCCSSSSLLFVLESVTPFASTGIASGLTANDTDNLPRHDAQSPQSHIRPGRFYAVPKAKEREWHVADVAVEALRCPSVFMPRPCRGQLQFRLSPWFISPVRECCDSCSTRRRADHSFSARSAPGKRRSGT